MLCGRLPNPIPTSHRRGPKLLRTLHQFKAQPAITVVQETKVLSGIARKSSRTSSILPHFAYMSNPSFSRLKSISLSQFNKPPVSTSTPNEIVKLASTLFLG